MNRSLLMSAFLVLLCNSAGAAAFDAKNYHDSKCTSCHTSDVYTRPNRGVTSYPQLQSRVAMCDANFGAKISDDNMSQLIDHLNDSYYKFNK